MRPVAARAPLACIYIKTPVGGRGRLSALTPVGDFAQGDRAREEGIGLPVLVHGGARQLLLLLLLQGLLPLVNTRLFESLVLPPLQVLRRALVENGVSRGRLVVPPLSARLLEHDIARLSLPVLRDNA